MTVDLDAVYQARWKYLRESSSQKFFNPDRHTPLLEYLDAIFPSVPVDEWVHDARIPKEVQIDRGGTDKRRSFMPDYRSESESLIVEFDGRQHYQDLKRIIKDQEADAFYRSLGYNVVRIPYFVQLSSVNIDHYFDVVLPDMCELRYSFYDSEDNIGISPGAMSLAGFERFRREYATLPSDTRQAIDADLGELRRECPAAVPFPWK
ncbi:DUF559 domain-containing protein [Nesterenkonia sp. Act20]|uniref:DUF559 domain-containing protein n=1 Tax=Nesterenkonia sp. Act20 TaxID=1483432 RepID=UPI001C46FCBF|nr:DUF559 domain-containing protein [Nesterenkonia sp. Act20]